MGERSTTLARLDGPALSRLERQRASVAVYDRLQIRYVADLDELRRQYPGHVFVPALGRLSPSEERLLIRQRDQPVLFIGVRIPMRRIFCRRWKCFDATAIPPPPPAPAEVVPPRPRAETPARLLQRIVALDTRNDVFGALDLIYETLEHWLKSDRLDRVDETLADVDVSLVRLEILLGFLTITVTSRERLPARPALCERIRAKGTDEKLPPADVDEVLRGVE